jgi:hypothetical protein
VGVGAADRDLTVRLPLAALVVLIAASLVGGCSGGPVSEAGLASPEPAASAIASGEPSSGAASPPVEPPATATVPPPTPNAPPPKPANTTFELAKQTPKGDGLTIEEYRITWTAPAGQATAFLVYGLPECLRYAKKYDGKPCVVRGMRIARDRLVLLATVPGDAREATVSWEVGEIDVPPYSAILIRATNDLGDSIFTIVRSENVCWGCVY